MAKTSFVVRLMVDLSPPIATRLRRDAESMSGTIASPTCHLDDVMIRVFVRLGLGSVIR